MWPCLGCAWLLFSMAAGAPAVSLQDPTGQELIFLRLAVNLAMMGPFAFVENEMVFQNPEPRRMEGRFSFVLPMDPSGSAAMPSRLAMEIQGQLMEGEVVNRSKAQHVYREILHEARDPALLEQSAGNVFTARVFPIEAHAVVRLILSYAITLPMRDLHRRLHIPLAGLPEIHDFSFSGSIQSLGGGFSANCSLPADGTNLQGVALENGALSFSMQETNLIPSSDIQVDVWEPMAYTRSFSVDGGQLVSSFVVEGNRSSSMSQFSPETWIIYVDTSASTADSFLVRIPIIEALLGQVPAGVREVKIFAFDIDVVEIFRANSSEQSSLLASSVAAGLRSRLPLGATDFEKLLQHVETQVPATNEELGVVVISDCIATANERAAQRLQQLLSPVANRVVEVAVLGTKFDSPLGAAIASAGGGRVVNIPLTSKNLVAVAQKAWSDLMEPMGQRGQLASGQGSSWVWPAAAFDLQDGDELVIFSGGEGLTLTAPELQLPTGTMTATNVQAAGPAFSSLLSREASRARLELLEAQRQMAKSKSEAKDIEFQLVRLSEQSRVMTAHTALLVLETNEDYVRFGIPQDRLSPILSVTDRGVELKDRGELQLSPLPAGFNSQQLEELSRDTSSNVTNDTETCQADQSECNLRVDDGDVTLQRMSTGVETASSGVKAHSATWFLLLFLCCLQILQGASAWANLASDAQSTIDKYGPSGPSERFRDNATMYSAALWTQRRAEQLRTYAASWITWDPSNDLAFEYLSKAAQHLGDPTTSLRAATSIAEVSPRSSEQLLRGAWLTLSLKTSDSIAWAVRLAARSLEEREDNVNTYRALALAYWMSNDFLAAGKTYARALSTSFHSRYGDVKQVLREEAALLLRSIQDSSPQIFQDLSSNELKEVQLTEGQSIRLWIALSWLTDANDVDLHVIDPNGEECYFGHRTTQLGLRLYSDQTQGLGPEVISLAAHVPGTYRIGAKYFSSGAMGASRGTVLVRQMVDGKIIGDPLIEVFTLPAAYSQVLPIVEVTVK